MWDRLSLTCTNAPDKPSKKAEVLIAKLGEPIDAMLPKFVTVRLYRYLIVNMVWRVSINLQRC